MRFHYAEQYRAKYSWMSAILSPCVVTRYTVVMHPSGMRLEWLDPPPFCFPLSLQQSNLKPQPREFQDQLTPLLYGLFMKHTLANGSVTAS